MAALTNTQISVTYVGLLKTNSSTVLSGTAQQIVDGAGTASPLYLSTSSLGIGGSPTAGKELDVTGNVLITGDIQIDNINIDGNTISATSGVVTLQDGTIATTQSQGDNSTKLATTAYVDAAIGANDTLAEILANGNTTGGTDIAVSAGDDITFTSTSKAIFGASLDLQLYSDGSNNYIDSTSNELRIRSNDLRLLNYGTGKYITADSGADVSLYYNNSKKLETTNTGISVTGNADISGEITVGTNDTVLQNDKLIFKSSTGAAIGHNTAATAIQFYTTTTTALDTLALTISGNDLTVSGELSVSGTGQSSFGGQVTIPATPVASTDAASKGYVDSKFAQTDTLAEVLALGNTTGGTDIAVSSGDDITFADDSKSIYGASSDLKIYHNTVDQEDSIIEATNHNLRIINTADNSNVTIQTDNGSGSIANYIIANGFSGAVELYHYGSKKFETTTNGVEVNGTLIDLDSAASATIAIDRGATTDDAIVSWRNAGSEYFRAGLDNTDSNLWSLLHTCGTGLYFDGSNMRFGFNTEPSYDIDLLKTNAVSMIRTPDTTSPTLGLFVNSGNNGVGTISVDNGGDMTFDTGSTGAGQAERMRIDSSGNVGINEDNPDTILHIQQPSNDRAGGIYSQVNGGNYGISMFVNSGGYGIIGGNGTYPNDVISMDFNNAYVGIGISPQFKLHVIGASATEATVARFAKGNFADSGGHTTIIGLGTENTASWTKAALAFERTSSYDTGKIHFLQDNTFDTSTATLSDSVFTIDRDGQIYNSGSTPTNGYNTFYGYQALFNRTTGVRNTAFGSLALDALTTGSYNTAFGWGNQSGTSTGSYNTSVGYDTSTNITSGIENSTFGALSGVNISNGNANSFFGYRSGQSTTSGLYSTYIGADAGYTVNNNENTFVGFYAGRLNTGGENVFIGSQSGGRANGGGASNNVAVGRGAMYSLSSGNENTAVGHQAGFNITTGVSNTVVGKGAGDAITAGSSNTALGQVALSAITTQTGNTAIGRASQQLGTGQYNTSVGNDTLENVTGSSNTAVGFAAGVSLTSGSYNVLMGDNAGRILGSGAENVLIGHQTGYSLSNGNYNTCVGFKNLNASSGASFNTSLGFAALYNSTGSTNTAVGAYAMHYTTSAGENTAVGYQALFTNTTGNYNSALGRLALTSNTTGQENTALGRLSLYQNTIGIRNTAVGNSALQSNTSGEYNTAVGDAAFANSTGSYNTAVGRAAGFSQTSGARNTYIGVGAGYACTSGYDNTGIGTDVLASLTTGANNIGIGRLAVRYAAGGNGNIGIGYSALGGATLSGTGNNIALGGNAGYNMTSGANNILIGLNAGRTGSQTPQSMGGVTTGSNQIHIGNESHTNALVQVSWTVNSDGRDKTDVKDLDLGLDFINSLRPVTYRWDKRSQYEDKKPTGEHKESKLEVGLIAQEVIEQENKAGYNFEDETNLFSWESEDKNKVGLQYEKLVPALINSIKELKQEIETLKSQINN